jgi:hypothetical protein
MKIFIAGIMQGSLIGHGIQRQDYRKLIREAVKANHPDADIVDPYFLFPDSVTYDDGRAKKVLFAMGEEAASSDIVIAYLPSASMGTALEMMRAYDNGKIILSISPMEKNWFIRAFSKKMFPTLDELITWINDGNLPELIDPPAA